MMKRREKEGCGSFLSNQSVSQSVNTWAFSEPHLFSLHRLREADLQRKRCQRCGIQPLECDRKSEGFGWSTWGAGRRAGSLKKYWRQHDL